LEVYAEQYSGNRERLEAKAAAHVVEEYARGWLSKDQVAPVKKEVASILGGKYTGRSATTVSPSMQQDVVEDYFANEFFENKELQEDVDLRADAWRILKSGQSVDIDVGVADATLAAIEPLISLVPEGHRVGSLVRLEPLKKHEGLVVAVAQDQHGDLFQVAAPRDALVSSDGGGARAFFHPHGAIIFVNLGRRTLSGQFRKALRGGFYHELIHALKAANRIDRAAWRALVSHARKLRVLNLSLGEMAAIHGEVSSNDTPLKDVYALLYDHMGIPEVDRKARINEEYVAYMVEFATHGYFSQEELAPVQDVLDSVIGPSVAVTDSSMSRAGADTVNAAVTPARPSDVDSLGYYSKALRAAKALKQNKGTPEQMLAQLKKAGVKDAEIEATGLRGALEGKTSVTKDEIVRHLEANRVKLNEVQRVPVRTKSDEALLNELGVETGDGFAAARANQGMREAKWEQYSLDPSNPTYRETVLHLPP